MSRQLGSVLGVAIFVAILGHPTAATALGAFRNAWSFMIAMTVASAGVLLAVGQVRIGAAESPAGAAESPAGAAESPAPAVEAVADAGGELAQPASV
jgi:hypothetical protein